jgi:hypothetical protein
MRRSLRHRRGARASRSARLTYYHLASHLLPHLTSPPIRVQEEAMLDLGHNWRSLVRRPPPPVVVRGI